MRRFCRLLPLAFLVAVACESAPEGNQLRVDLRTDFAPGTEFDAVTVSLGRGDIQASFSHVVNPLRSYVTGVALGDTRVQPGPTMPK